MKKSQAASRKPRLLRLLALSLVCVLVLGLLAGCGEKKEEPETTQSPASTGTPAETPTGESADSEPGTAASEPEEPSEIATSEPVPAETPENTAEPVETGEPAETEPMEPAETGEPVETEPVEPAETGDPAETEPVEPVETGEPAETEPEEPDEFSGITERSSYTLEELHADDPRLDEAVAVCGSDQLTNRQLQVYYYMQFFNFMSQYGDYISYFGLDPDSPLDEQMYLDGEQTWEQVFLREALGQYRQLAAVGEAARAEGFVLPQSQEEQIQSVLEGMAGEAETYGLADADAYIQASFGEGVDMETYEAFLRDYFYGMAYVNNLYDAYPCTDEELLAYVNENPDYYEGMETDKPNVHIRHILITPEDADGDGVSTEEEKTAAREKAEALLEEYLKNPSEEYFAALANANSADPGSNTNGGLYEDVYPGQMVQPFNDWCFDEARQVGDTGIVETSYGYHLMFFVAQTQDYYWKQVVKEDYLGEEIDAQIEQIFKSYPIEVNYDAIVLSPMPRDLAAGD